MPASYRFLQEEENVKVKVPQKGLYMEFIPAHSFKVAGEKTVFVENHWRSKSSIDGQLVQRNFFGITEEQLGKNIVGKVKVQTKKTSISKEDVLLIDIWANTKNAPTEYKLAFEKDEAGRLRLNFRTIRQPKKSAA